MMWSPVLQNVETDAYELLTDNAGKVFADAAVEYMKYRGASAIAEKLFSSLGMFRQAEETTKLLETKAATEEALAEIDYCVLELFESVDGCIRDEDGIKKNLWGRVKVKNNFVKQILGTEPTMISAQINHPELFEAVKDRYVNPQELFVRMGEYLKRYEEVQAELGQINRRLEEISAEDVTDDPELALELAALGTEKTLHLAEIEVIRLKYFGCLRGWKSTVSGCASAGAKARESLQMIRTKQKLAKSRVLQYEDELLAVVGKLDSSLYEDLTAGLDTMKQYVGLPVQGKERIIDIDRMEASIEVNTGILSQMLMVISDVAEDGSLENERVRLAQMSSLISGYSHDGLCFDYSGMHLKAEGKSPVESARELLLGGVSSLVLKDVDSVSRAVFSVPVLPEGLQRLLSPGGEKNSGQDTVSINFFPEKDETTGMSSTLSALNRNSPFAGVSEWIVREGTDAVNRILFLSYLDGHFSNYVKLSEQKQTVESVLDYEQEYILCGNTKDELNLYAVISKILLVRLSFNLIHVLCDAEKTGTAGEIALGLLGVTGLPVLVSIMKFLILFVLAVEAALVETAAILQGKKLALVPAKSDFPVSFPELLLMSRTGILEKAENLQDKTGVSLGYSEYMMLFLLLQGEDVQCARILALIQENLALEEGTIRVSQMVCTFVIKAEYLLPKLFTAMPFSNRKTGGYII